MRYVDELTDAVRSQLALAYGVKDQLGYAVRARLREGYTTRDLVADGRAGVMVGLLTLPLALALARTVGVAPQHGLYAAIVGALVAALLGGSRLQVSGPTAALAVLLQPIAMRYGLGGLLLCGLMAGGLLVVMGVARLGRLIQFVPHPVTTGLTAAVAVLVVLTQLRDALGIELTAHPTGTIELVRGLWDARHTVQAADAVVAGATLALLVATPRFLRRGPAPLVVLAVVAVAVAVVTHLATSVHVHTIASSFTSVIDGETVHGLPPLPPLPALPWHRGDASGARFAVDYHVVRELLPAAFSIAMLGAIDSLRTAVVADGMAGGPKHDPNAELIALGIGNALCACFGGIACAGALTRTATNLRAGARSPFAAAIAAVLVLACTIALAPLLSRLPLAGLAGLMVYLAWQTSEARHFVRLLRIAPRSDVVVLLVCFVLAVLFDLALAVSVGVVLAALLFMRRMAVLTRITLDTSTADRLATPPGVRLYEIAGPMFFGAATVAMEALDNVGSDAETVIVSLRRVDVMDATGLVALESIVDRLRRSGRKVILCGLGPEVAALVDRAGIKRIPGELAFAPDVDTAVSMAIVHTARAGA